MDSAPPGPTAGEVPVADKDVTALVRRLRKADWTVDQNRKTNYYYAYPPGQAGKPVRIPSTPSSPRWYKNTLAELRRYGYEGT